MDYRTRKYYLIKTDRIKYDEYHRRYRMAAPSVVYHSPYKLFEHDREFNKGLLKEYVMGFPDDLWRPQEMVSCKIEESKRLEDLFRLLKFVHRNGSCNYFEITKEKIDQ